MLLRPPPFDPRANALIEGDHALAVGNACPAIRNLDLAGKDLNVITHKARRQNETPH